MVKTSYLAYALKPEEIRVCKALDAGNYPQLYTERVNQILGDIKVSELKERVKRTLGSFEERDGKLAQSSPYGLIVLKDILPKGEVPVARSRLQTAKSNDPNFMSGFYIDCGLNLITGEEGYQANSAQASAIADDLTSVGINLTNPKLIPYSILTHAVDGNSPSGLVFELSEKGKDLAKINILNTLDFNWNYLPSRNGLFRAYLDRDGGWGAADEYLVSSNDNGRVVVETTGEASKKNFKDLQDQTVNLLDRQRKEREDLIARLRQ